MQQQQRLKQNARAISPSDWRYKTYTILREIWRRTRDHHSTTKRSGNTGWALPRAVNHGGASRFLDLWDLSYGLRALRL